MFFLPGGCGFTMAKDTGVPLIDENGSRMKPFSSVEPLFHSLLHCVPDFDLNTVDIVTDR